MTIPERFQDILRGILDNNFSDITGINIERHFTREGMDTLSKLEKLNASFLVKYSGEKHSHYNEACEYIEKLSAEPEWSEITAFLNRGVSLVYAEIESCFRNSSGFRERFENLHSLITSPPENNGGLTIKKIRDLFFPEGCFEPDEIEKEISILRNKRKVSITRLNSDNIKNPGNEILFTSNALITLPAASADINKIETTITIKEQLKEIAAEEQLYWYDHPVQIGVSPENNELIYGLENFDRSLVTEEKMGLKDKNDKVDFVLSVSVTHKGLHRISRDYIENELKKNSRTSRLNIYVFTEKETGEILDDILVPAAERFLGIKDTGTLYEIFGVDGEYGRHYTFLKAVSALWSVLISNETRGTFKIDLDQVFPQDVLLENTGSTAFGHLKSRLWGASGIDSLGKPVHLGLIAGALVNEKDIRKSLFTPDVTFPNEGTDYDTLVFNSTLPQALSTVAEMQTRYSDEPDINGVDACIQRIHVTGGTNGILVDSLRKYRPFTPSFIGRAEDQAYIMSVLFDEKNEAYLRYVHRDGLIMRHDKEAFASDSIKAAKIGKMIGDYLRIILFSNYADSLPWPAEKIKEGVDPFTGCFISGIPWTLVILRLMLKTASLLEDGGSRRDGYRFLKLGSERLWELLESLQTDSGKIAGWYKRERKGWDLYYDILDVIEEKLHTGDAFAGELRDRAKEIVNKCMIKL